MKVKIYKDVFNSDSMYEVSFVESSNDKYLELFRMLNIKDIHARAYGLITALENLKVSVLKRIESVGISHTPLTDVIINTVNNEIKGLKEIWDVSLEIQRDDTNDDELKFRVSANHIGKTCCGKTCCKVQNLIGNEYVDVGEIIFPEINGVGYTKREAIDDLIMMLDKYSIVFEHYFEAVRKVCEKEEERKV